MLLDTRRLAMAFLGMMVLLVSCSSAIPSKYVQQAVPGITLTTLVTSPSDYDGKVVILGGVIVEERRSDGRVWLHMKNRPVDSDYQPHRDASMVETESGFYWIVADPKGLPKNYRDWARLTVVGKVMATKFEKAEQNHGRPKEPILGALYLRGWGYGAESPGWEATQDPNYLVTSPLVIPPIQ